MPETLRRSSQAGIVVRPPRRQGRYHVARLLAELGAGARLTDWLHERTADCPQKSPTGPTRACGAVMPDLVELP
jgi:hypothetical protein